MGADFSGYATKANLRCSDGRTIMPNAFKAQNGMKVPLVWQHGSNDPENVLGHALLEDRADGVYAYCYFNKNPKAVAASELVSHGDISRMSIYANRLVEKSKQVFHGAITEVSLVLAGANPGAIIDFVAIRHDGGEIEEIDEAIIYTDLPLEHEDGPGQELKEELKDTPIVPEEKPVTKIMADVVHADDSSDDETIRDVYESMNQKQKDVLHFMIGQAIEDATAEAEHSDDDEDDDNLTHEEDYEVTRNVFEQNDKDGHIRHELSHGDVQSILQTAKRPGFTLKTAVEDYALQHGITDIDTLFPDAKSLTNSPEWDKRRTEWVAGVMNKTTHVPFSRIKTRVADLTFEEARAKGYVKGTLKKEEFFGVSQRTTGPTTVYKKQQLDRDDILDITDFDVVAWLKIEMRMMLEEEIARAILFGDGREVENPDKIKDPAGAADGNGIRSIYKDHELYVTKVYVNIDDANSTPAEIVDALLEHRTYYKGTGTPTFYTTERIITKLLLAKDTTGRRLYRTLTELADELRVSEIVPVEAMEDEATLVGIMVNLVDYTIGADRGGDVNMFDDFDIDYNQYKYLTETRLSGALNKVKSAIVIEKVPSGAVLVVPAMPTFDRETGALTIVNQTGVVYKHGVTTINAGGSPYTVDPGETWIVTATPASSSYYFSSSKVDNWTFTADE